ncbi:diguanylate phosphodiesterase [Pseudomonas aeruginosa]|nr:diguanylate phosphodiesterase [Pseudomonas aeruginosa]
MPFLPGKMPKPAVCRRPATSFHADLAGGSRYLYWKHNATPSPHPRRPRVFRVQGDTAMDWQGLRFLGESPIDGYVLQNCTYSPSLVALAFLVACLAGYTALDMVERVGNSLSHPRLWQWIGAFCLGSGIWATHFVAMLAFHAPIALRYDLPITGLSLLIAVAASYLAMYMTARPRFGLLPCLLAACCIGLGIAAMHYTGMAAMRSVATQYYQPSLFALSVLIAIGAAFTALAAVPYLRGRRSARYRYMKLIASLLLAGAIAAMHFTGMAALVLSVPAGTPLELQASADSLRLGWLTGVLASAIAACGIWAAWSEKQRERRLSENSRVNALLNQLDHAHASLRQMARYDSLTGLQNRTAFNEVFVQHLENCRLRGKGLAVMFLDLDHFKRINDSLGHDSGDQLLKIVSERIRSVLRDSDVVARFAGDEFCVLADLTQDHEAHILSQRLMQKMKEPIALDGRTLVMTASVGVSLYPNDGEQCEELLKNAGLALHQSKACGRNNAQFFSRQLLVRATQELQMEEELRQALRDDQLELHYQPILALADGEVHQLEALVRWRHPTQGLLGPDRFIGLAEANGMIDQLDDWVLRRACRDLRSLHLAGHERLRVAVNCCASNLGRASLVDEVRHALEQAGLAACFLELEVTEDALMYNIDQTIPLLERLRELGVSLSIDDFGTGYSSLAYLRRLPLDALKVDRSFIMDIPASQRDMEIAQAIIAMAQKLHLKVVAEGVETPQQLALLRENHCELVQGYLFSRPLPLAALEEFLRAYRFDAAPPLRSLNQA